MVAGTNADDTRRPSSDWGPCVDLFAPGGEILAATTGSQSSHATVSGTSYAAPHVTGIVAIYLQESPGATPAQVRDAVVSWATTGRLDGSTLGVGSPNRLSFAPPPTTAAVGGPSALPAGAGTYVWNAMAGGGDFQYVYHWEYRPWGGAWASAGTGPSHELTVTGGEGDFELRLTVTSAGDTASATHNVLGPCHADPFVMCPESDVHPPTEEDAR